MIPVAEPFFDERELELVTDCIRSGWVSWRGRYVKEFEDSFSNYFGSKASLSTSSGTGALHLALEAYGVGKGDEVVIPSFTYIGTANAVRYTGAEPVLVDVEPDTWTLDVNSFKKALTDSTKAVIPVHIYGHPCDMDPLLEVAGENGIWVVEDVAEAHGSRYRGRLCGTLGDCGCFSFFGNKLMTCGEGGMIISEHRDFVGEAELLRNQGVVEDGVYYHAKVGYSYRMTNMQAALGCAQLEKMDGFIKKKTEVAGQYMQNLRDVDGITLPVERDWALNTYWLYTILVDAEKRDPLIKALAADGIETKPTFIPIHMQPPYEQAGDFPVSEDVAARGISLPSSVNLSKDQIQWVSSKIREKLGG